MIVLVLVITYIKYKYCEIKKIVTSIRHRKCFKNNTVASNCWRCIA